MSKPYIHAVSSAKKFGGKPEDYIEIHSFLDSSKSAIADNRHRAITHSSFFLSVVLERIHFSNSNPMLPNSTFPTITNSDGKVVSVRDIGEQHVLEDFRGRFIPSAQDYLSEMEYQPWMQNGEGVPPSFKKIDDGKKKMVKDFFVDGSKEPAVIPWPTTKEPPFRFPGELKD